MKTTNYKLLLNIISKQPDDLKKQWNHFFKWAKENNFFRKWVSNFNKNKDINLKEFVKKPFDAIHDAFNWHDTKRSPAYWAEYDYKWIVEFENEFYGD
jgi:hypothetical protein